MHLLLKDLIKDTLRIFYEGKVRKGRKKERKKEERKKKAKRLAGIETLYLNNTRRVFYHCVTTLAQLL